MWTNSHSYQRQIDECLAKAQGWLITDAVAPALGELDKAVQFVEESARDGTMPSQQMQLMKLVSMVHRCKACPNSSATCVADARKLSMRILNVSRGPEDTAESCTPASRH